MPTSSDVLKEREAGQENPEENTVRLVTLVIDSPNISQTVRIVNGLNTVEDFIAEGNTYIPYPFSEKLNDIKPGIKPEVTFSFAQIAEEQEEALIEVASVYPWSEVTRQTWEITEDGTITKTSEFLFPMPVRRISLGDKGTIDVICAEDDLDDIVMNSTVYTTDDHPGLKAVIT